MKPSIFSREYDRKMKRRKKVITAFVIILAIVGVMFFAGIKAKSLINNDYVSKIKYKISNTLKVNNKSAKDNTDVKTNSKETITNEPVKEVKEIEENGYEVKLPSGKAIKVIYEIRENQKIFKYITPMESPIEFNISPAGTSVVILDTKTQSMLYLDINGNLKDISYKQYVSTDGSTFFKDDYIKNNPLYVWTDSPKFIDEENIVYISQLPWFIREKTAKYIWITNVKNGTYRCFESISGESFKFNGVNNSLINVNIDGNNQYLSANGEISQ